MSLEQKIVVIHLSGLLEKLIDEYLGRIKISALVVVRPPATGGLEEKVGPPSLDGELVCPAVNAINLRIRIEADSRNRGSESHQQGQLPAIPFLRLGQSL
jgi:hypothetical protein